MTPRVAATPLGVGEDRAGSPSSEAAAPSGPATRPPGRPAGTRGRRRSRSAGRPGWAHEQAMWRQGHLLVAGVDEVGRGAWAGPLSVGVAVVRDGAARIPRGLRDSKQLAEDVRESLFDKVAAWCAAWAVGHAGPEECDRLGMTASLRLATGRAFAQLAADVLPDAVVLDGSFDYVSPPAEPRLFDPDAGAGDTTERPAGELGGASARLPGAPSARPPWDPAGVGASAATGCVGDTVGVDGPWLAERGWAPIVETVVKGDARCASVAAASVLAKVTRDRIMRASAGSYPPFEFDRNKGYPSPAHQRALCGYGLSAVHRRSWAFVANLPWGLTSWPRRAGDEVAGSDDLDGSDPDELDPALRDDLLEEQRVERRPGRAP